MTEIPMMIVERHLKLFPPEAWVNQMILQGKQGIGAPPVWHQAWWWSEDKVVGILNKLAPGLVKS